MNILGLQIEVNRITITGGIPAYLESEYTYYRAKVNDMDFILMHPESELGYVSTILKHMELIHHKTGLHTALWIETLSSYRKANFLQNQVPFILGSSQMYLPFIGAVLYKETTHTSYLNDRFTLSAQLLLTLYINRGKERLYVTDAVNALSFSNMTISRAVSQLVESGMFQKGKDGVKVFITTNLDALKLFEQGKPYFCSPVLRTGYIDKERLEKNAVPAGTSALSQMSLLSEGKFKEYAIDKMLSTITLIDESYDYFTQCELQIWKYNPLMFSNTTIPDAFSIAVSLSENTDPRVEVCIEEMLRNTYMRENLDEIGTDF